MSQLRVCRVKPWISKDYDVVVSCISLLVGGILIFQVGWFLLFFVVVVGREEVWEQQYGGSQH